MSAKIRLGEIEWYPREVVYRRDNGKTYAKLTPTLHMQVAQKGRHRAWTALDDNIEKLDPNEMVELIDMKK
jgi:hypothetical protein